MASLSNKSETLSQKYPTQERAGGVAQVIEYLSSKCEALSSNSSTAKKKTKKNPKGNKFTYVEPPVYQK
jgi:hypothetical protein